MSLPLMGSGAKGSIGTQSCTLPTEAKQSKMNTSIESLHSSIGCLKDRIGLLANRLEPIMDMSCDVPSDVCQEKKGNLPRLTEQIETAIDETIALRACIDEIITRIVI